MSYALSGKRFVKACQDGDFQTVLDMLNGSHSQGLRIDGYSCLDGACHMFTKSQDLPGLVEARDKLFELYPSIASERKIWKSASGKMSVKGLDFLLSKNPAPDEDILKACLLVSSKAGSVVVAEKLLSLGAPVNFITGGAPSVSPLSLAASSKHDKAVELLLSHGANPLLHNGVAIYSAFFNEKTTKSAKSAVFERMLKRMLDASDFTGQEFLGSALLARAIPQGCNSALKSLYRKGCRFLSNIPVELERDLRNSIRTACEKGDFATLKTIQEMGVVLSDERFDVVSAVSSSGPGLLGRFLKEFQISDKALESHFAKLDSLLKKSKNAKMDKVALRDVIGAELLKRKTLVKMGETPRMSRGL